VSRTTTLIAAVGDLRLRTLLATSRPTVLPAARANATDPRIFPAPTHDITLATTTA
jgi:hypothetical protein